ncbi:hypothetical protein TNCV_3615201 [Trichonephila clavipes]|nr:hypothetical protein TNCV_3615201 [Trichonephila clavipes]
MVRYPNHWATAAPLYSRGEQIAAREEFFFRSAKTVGKRNRQKMFSIFTPTCIFEKCSFHEDQQETATAGSNVVQSGRPIFDDFSNICGRLSAITRRMLSSKRVKRLWLIRIDQ